MEDRESKTTIGRLDSLEHLWEEGVFKMSYVEIKLKDKNVLYSKEIYGFIPEFLIGEKVSLFEKREGEQLIQLLESQDRKYKLGTKSRKFAYTP